MYRRMQVAALCAAVVIAPALLPAQSLKDRIKRRAEQSVGRRVDKAVDCAMGDARCIDKARAEGKTVNEVPAKGEAASASQGEEAATATVAAPAAGGADALKPGEGAWANYDFKPGERILYADDFSRDQVGDFPRSLEFKEGSIEVVEWQGGRYLRATGDDNQFIVNLPETLPQRYTIEFDYANPSGYGWGGLLIGFNGKDAHNEGGTNRFRCNHDKAGLDGSGEGTPQALKAPGGSLASKMFRCRLMVDGSYAKVYVNETRLANVPNAKLGRMNKLHFTVYTREGDKNPAMIGNVRIGAGGRKLYDALAEKGRVATQGIYFDIGSDRIRPESTPTLKEIGAMLSEHADLKLAIEGHTDNSGNAASNQTLSEKRAAAVVRYLVESAGVSAERVSSRGFGAEKPAASNDTPEGRQSNRRVELVKM